MTKFRNKYRIPSARAAWWDYSNSGSYFITICTHQKRHFFGNIVDSEMFLSAIGKIVLEEWDISFGIRKELFCDAFVIMPNHLHAILRIEPSDSPAIENISTGVAYRAPKSISSFVAGYKSSVTKRVNLLKGTEKNVIWQARFHDSLIRNDISYINIAKYIDNNPTAWEKDRFWTRGQ